MINHYGFTVVYFLVDSTTISNRKVCTNPNDRWFTDSNKNVQFSFCIDSSKVKSNKK